MAEQVPAVDFSGFDRQGSGISGLPALIGLAATLLGEANEATLPQNVPWYILDAMAFDPYVFLGERIWAAPLCDRAIYRVDHPDSAIRAEVEAWWDPLQERYWHVVSSAFALGLSAYILDWVAEGLAISVARDGKKPFTRSLPEHQHYNAIHDLHPGSVDLTVQADKLAKITFEGQDYLAPGRAYISVWGQRFGSWLGNGSRRRAYGAWYKSCGVDIWQGRYLERSVDPPRVGHAPPGTTKLKGTDMTALELLNRSLMALKNGGAVTLPGGVERDTNLRAYNIEVMDLPDRADVFHRALDAAAVDKFVASLVPPTAAGVKDAAFATGRVHAELLEDLLNQASNWMAAQGTPVVQAVHRVRYGLGTVEPRIVAREFPRAKAKRLLEIYRGASDAQRQTKDGRVYTLNDLVDEAILAELGVRTKSIEDVAHEKPAPPVFGPPGPDKDATSDRQDRRDNAREPEGEDATGGPDEGVE